MVFRIYYSDGNVKLLQAPNAKLLFAYLAKQSDAVQIYKVEEAEKRK